MSKISLTVSVPHKGPHVPQLSVSCNNATYISFKGIEVSHARWGNGNTVPKKGLRRLEFGVTGSMTATRFSVMINTSVILPPLAWSSPGLAPATATALRSSIASKKHLTREKLLEDDARYDKQRLRLEGSRDDDIPKRHRSERVRRSDRRRSELGQCAEEKISRIENGTTHDRKPYGEHERRLEDTNQRHSHSRRRKPIDDYLTHGSESHDQYEALRDTHGDHKRKYRRDSLISDLSRRNTTYTTSSVDKTRVGKSNPSRHRETEQKHHSISAVYSSKEIESKEGRRTTREEERAREQQPSRHKEDYKTPYRRSDRRRESVGLVDFLYDPSMYHSTAFDGAVDFD